MVPGLLQPNDDNYLVQLKKHEEKCKEGKITLTTTVKADDSIEHELSCSCGNFRVTY